VKIYTRKGDDGTTGLLYGGRVPKDATGPAAGGDVDEAVACLGLARAMVAPSRELADELLRLQRSLFVVGAELATAPENRVKLEAEVSLVSSGMVGDLERRIDAVVADRGMPAEFVVPGANAGAAAIDLARAVIRRAERHAVTHERGAGITGGNVVPYLNRLADYLFMLARAAEESWTPTREGNPS